MVDRVLRTRGLKASTWTLWPAWALSEAQGCFSTNLIPLKSLAVLPMPLDPKLRN